MIKIEYKDIVAFHPGYYLRDILDEMEMSQDEFAKRLGVSGKTVSQLLNGKIPLSNDIAMRLSAMLGISAETFLNLQKKYDEKVLKIESHKNMDEQTEMLDYIDYYNFFVKNGFLEKTTDRIKKVMNLCSFLHVSDLRILRRKDLFASYRITVSNETEKNIVNANIWLQTALNIGTKIHTDIYNEKKLKDSVPRIRQLTMLPPEEFLPELTEIFRQCGVAFVLLPSLKNAGVNGVVKWYDNRAVLAVSDRFSYADSFWFTLFHEIKHVLQRKKTKVIVSDCFVGDENEEFLEREADSFANETLINPTAFGNFISEYALRLSRFNIIEFAQSQDIHPGIVVGRLQHCRIIPYSKYSDLRVKFKITVNS